MAQKSSVRIKVLTLNCWGLYYPISQFRTGRIEAIGKEISKGKYDIVLLQEIWIQKDYETLCKLILGKLPYTHYFHSGMFGSGLCIFSRYSILETFQHQFSLCGFAHKFYHGDWFGGKAIGLVQVLCEGFRVNVYVTHTHADYGEANIYAAHRTAQAYELSQFIKHTSEGCDAVIVGGDFNYKSDHPSFKMVLTNCNLLDAWISQKSKQLDDDGLTSGVRNSLFTSPTDPGKRIDYILYKNNSGTTVSCEACFTTMKQIPDKPYPYSDHAGVAAELTLHKNVTAFAQFSNLEELENCFNQALPVIDDGLKKAKADQVFYGIVLILCVIGLSFIWDLPLPFGFTIGLSVLRAVLMLGIGFCAWMGIIGCSREVNVLTAVRKDIANLLKSKGQI